MAYEAALQALADPTRRAIFERLREGPRAVGELAAGLPVSRPAVSQHLRVLREADLVREQRQGTRNLYSVAPEGLEELREYLDSYWGEVLGAFKRAAEKKAKGGEMPEKTGLAVRKTIVLKAPQELAFRVFTEEIATWWPLATHSVFDEHAVNVTVEGCVGGRVYETSDTGEESVWGNVTAWEPPARFAMTWHPGADPAEYTDLEVSFTAEGEATRVVLVHTGWERRGEKAQAMQQSYTAGWDIVLSFYTKEMAARA